MTDQTLPDQDTATLALMMEREVDKRVAIALNRMLSGVSNSWREAEIERAYTSMNPGDIQRIMRSLFIETVMTDGSLMSQIRSKLAEQLNKHY